MTVDDTTLTAHPAPHRDRVLTVESLFGLVGGPVGWFLQLCIGYGFASTPCFVDGTRTPTLGDASVWAWHLMLIATIAALVLGLFALWVSWRALQKTKEEIGGGHGHLIEISAGRTRFLALWGVCLGAGFSLVTLLTFVGYVALPRCVG